MRIIGITGGIGSGKSEVLRYMAGCGAHVVEADRVAHTLMGKGGTAYQSIVEYFGEAILDGEGEIDRKALGGIVFQDEEKLKALNGIVHPAVKAYILSDIEVHRAYGTIYYVIEAALLIQDGYKAICDELWYIYVNRDDRIRRLVAGRGGDAKQYSAVMQSQENEEFYRKYCDVVIDNSGSLADTQNAIKALLNS